TDFEAPVLTDPWGDVCKLSIASVGVQGGGQNMSVDGSEAFGIFPNPNRGDQFRLSVANIEDGVRTVSVDIYDLFGKRVSTRTLAVNDTFVDRVVELNGELASGMYMVNVTAGSNTYVERLVIQP
ncbi:MAG TPA: T9SS type A sorting domain-containing protein, partial [Flavobacteriales bacterium]|nr:T9SS type A sorting domain-containing protein [Flavobacteriales bacterium]